MATLTLSISAILAIIAGITILAWPKVINYVIGIWLMIYGILQLIDL